MIRSPRLTHAPRGTPWHHTIRRDEPPKYRVVVARMIIQEANAVQVLELLRRAALCYPNLTEEG
jgi:hypothetical protein